MKKFSRIITAFMLVCALAVPTACGKKEETKKPNEQPPVVTPTEDEIVLEVEASEIAPDTGKATLYLGSSYEFKAAIYKNEVRQTLPAGITWNVVDGSVISTADLGGKISVEPLKAGETTVTVSAVYEGKTLSATCMVTVEKLVRLRASTTEVALFDSVDISGNPVDERGEYTVTASVYDDETRTAKPLDGAQLTWSVADETVVTVENGVFTAVGNGSTTVTAAYEGESFEVAVNIFTPVYSADDLDALALCTYYESAEKATEILSANYMLMNDIDYSAHVRNFILPIASPNAEDGANFASVLASAGGYYSYYSKVWQEMFDLEEYTGESGGILLRDKKTQKPFEGINPNGVEFSGIFDGNGYSLKNAWLMLENVLFTCYHESTQQYTVGNMCFIGVNSGTVRNLAFEDIEIGAVETFAKTDENGNRYYEYNQNPVHYYFTDPVRIEAHKAENPIWHLYGGVSYETSVGDAWKVLSWTTWGSRFSAGNAFILHNKGEISNVYARYRNDSNVSLGMTSGGITLINDGTVTDCVLELDLLKYAAQGGKDMEPMHPIAAANYGTVKNVNVITDKTTTLIDNDSGNTSGAGTYVELNAFLNDGNVLNGYSVSKWSFTNVVSMVKNLHGF